MLLASHSCFMSNTSLSSYRLLYMYLICSFICFFSFSSCSFNSAFCFSSLPWYSNSGSFCYSCLTNYKDPCLACENFCGLLCQVSKGLRETLPTERMWKLFVILVPAQFRLMAPIRDSNTRDVYFVCLGICWRSSWSYAARALFFFLRAKISLSFWFIIRFK